MLCCAVMFANSNAAYVYPYNRQACLGLLTIYYLLSLVIFVTFNSL